MTSMKWILYVLMAIALPITLPIGILVLLIDETYQWLRRRYYLWRLSEFMRRELRECGWDEEDLEIPLHAFMEAVKKAIEAKNSANAACGLGRADLGEFYKLYKQQSLVEGRPQ